MSHPADDRLPPGREAFPFTPDAFLSRAAVFLDRTRRTVRDSLQLAGHALSRVDRLIADISRDGREVVVSATALWRSVEAAFDEAALTAKATPRVARILKEIAHIAAVYRMYHIKRPWQFGLNDEGAARELDALHRREAKRLRLLLEDLGGGVLKVGQFLSCRADLLPAAWIDELRLLQDSVPAAPAADVRALLRDELATLWPREGDLDAWLADFDPIPVAAASLAQVHRAVLKDDPSRSVAIKIQRPGIDQLIAQDRRALAIIADLLAPLFTQIALVPVLAEIGRSLDGELDFAAEAANAERFATVARVPSIIASTPRLIIMEFIEGERLVAFLDAATADGSDARRAERDRILESLARTTAEAILVHGLVHADPHPGNFLVARPAHDPSGAPELVVLDFGATVALTSEERRAVVALLPAMFGRNEPRVRELLAVLGFSAPDPDAPAKFAMAIAATLIPSDLATIDPRAELERGLALAREYPGMVVPGAFVQIGRSLAGLGGLFLTYRPAVDLGSILMLTLARA